MTEAYEMISKTELEGLRARLEKLEAASDWVRGCLDINFDCRGDEDCDHCVGLMLFAALDEKEPS